jgi:hypothetical protein
MPDIALSRAPEDILFLVLQLIDEEDTNELISQSDWLWREIPRTHPRYRYAIKPGLRTMRYVCPHWRSIAITARRRFPIRMTMLHWTRKVAKPRDEIPAEEYLFWIKKRLLKYDGDSDFGIWMEAKSSNTLIKFYTSVVVPSRSRPRFLRLQFSFVEVTETIMLHERFPKLTSVLIFGCCEAVEFEHPLTNLENLTLYSFRKRLVSDS